MLVDYATSTKLFGTVLLPHNPLGRWESGTHRAGEETEPQGPNGVCVPAFAVSQPAGEELGVEQAQAEPGAHCRVRPSSPTP